MALLRLSTEILIQILLYLDVPDAYAIQSVNHFLNSMYKDSLELQYVLECKVAHVRDNSNCHLPVGDRLRMLRDQEGAWMSLKPTLQRTISPLPKFSPFTYLWPAIERGHYLLYDSSTIKSLPLQECHENIVRSFEINNLKLVCCCIDEHDLIACLTCPQVADDNMQVQIKLIQHSTGVAHPFAANPTIILGTTVADTMHREGCAMEVFGENLALIIPLENKVWLYVFDWMTGMAKCKPVQISTTTGIVVLDGDLILIPDFASFSLHVYHIPPSSTGGAVKLICQLCLPDPTPLKAFPGIECHCAPNPTGDGKFPKHVPSSVPFIDDPTTALTQIIWNLWSDDPDSLYQQPYSVSLIVHRHSITNTLPPSNRWSTPAVIEWETWGSCFTDQSFITGFFRLKFHHVIHGQRSLLSINNSSHIGGRLPADTLLKNFNKYHARRALLEKGYNNPDPGLSKSKKTLPFCQSDLPVQSKQLDYSITDGLIVGFYETELPNGDFTYSLDIMHFGHQR